MHFRRPGVPKQGGQHPGCSAPDQGVIDQGDPFSP